LDTGRLAGWRGTDRPHRTCTPRSCGAVAIPPESRDETTRTRATGRGKARQPRIPDERAPDERAAAPAVVPPEGDTPNNTPTPNDRPRADIAANERSVPPPAVERSAPPIRTETRKTGRVPRPRPP